MVVCWRWGGGGALFTSQTHTVHHPKRVLTMEPLLVWKYNRPTLSCSLYFPELVGVAYHYDPPGAWVGGIFAFSM